MYIHTIQNKAIEEGRFMFSKMEKCPGRRKQVV